MKYNVMFWHRWLGILACVGLVLWGSSGLSHPIMTHLQPLPAVFSSPGQQFDLSSAITARSLLIQHKIDQVAYFGLASINGRNYYRISQNPGAPARYFEIATGNELENGDARHAQALASHFTGRPAAEISKTELVTVFSDDYHAVNRLLPVWRVEFSGNGHLRAFIDTEQSRLSTLVDDTRYMLTRFFQFGHTWSFINDAPGTQLAIMSTLLLLILSSAVSGLYLYLRQLRRNRIRLAKLHVRRWHRRLGLIVSLATLLLAGSGLFHLIMSYQQQIVSVQTARPIISSTQLNDDIWRNISLQPLAKLDLLSHAENPYWFVLPAAQSDVNQMPEAQVGMLSKNSDSGNQHHEHGSHNHHARGTAERPQPYVVRADISSSNTATTDSVKLLAQQQAAAFAEKPLSDIQHAEWVSQFSGEYGFIFKRLPVIKVAFAGAGNPRYFIEPGTGILAATITDIDQTEGWVFGYLHKWSFMDFNKTLRDILVSLFALGNVVVGILGLILFARRFSGN